VAGVLLGVSSIAFLPAPTALAQTEAAPEIRGRVPALQAMSFLASTPPGGPAVGWAAQPCGARSAIALRPARAPRSGARALAHGPVRDRGLGLLLVGPSRRSSRAVRSRGSRRRVDGGAAGHRRAPVVLLLEPPDGLDGDLHRSAAARHLPGRRRNVGNERHHA